MCRLVGWAAAQPISAAEVIGDDVEQILELSRLHQDGWGAAWCGPNGLTVVREPEAAHEGEGFVPTLGNAIGTTGIVHLRWATTGSRCPENTHPFTHEQIAFMHNGSLPVDGALATMVDPDLLEQVAGTTDSELYFAAVLTAHRRHGDPARAIAEVIGGLEGEAWPSLNAMWIDADRLVVVAAAAPELRNPRVSERYYELRWEQTDAGVNAWSYDVRGEESERGVVLPDRHMLIVDLDGSGGLTPRVVALDEVLAAQI